MDALMIAAVCLAVLPAGVICILAYTKHDYTKEK